MTEGQVKIIDGLNEYVLRERCRLDEIRGIIDILQSRFEEMESGKDEATKKEKS